MPNATAANRTVRTAIGRRFQLFSPSPETKGSASSAKIAITGPINITGVSSDGGSRDSTAYNHRKKKSGRGTVWIIEGSGWPFGPYGPKYAAHAVIERRTRPEKTASFHTAYGTNGT